MSKRDWFTKPPQGGFYIVDTSKTPMGMHDASRPDVVMESYYGGYRTGMTTGYHGRYATLDAAKQRVRYCERNK